MVIRHQKLWWFFIIALKFSTLFRSRKTRQIVFNIFALFLSPHLSLICKVVHLLIPSKGDDNQHQHRSLNASNLRGILLKKVQLKHPREKNLNDFKSSEAFPETTISYQVDSISFLSQEVKSRLLVVNNFLVRFLSTGALKHLCRRMSLTWCFHKSLCCCINHCTELTAFFFLCASI